MQHAAKETTSVFAYRRGLSGLLMEKKTSEVLELLFKELLLIIACVALGIETFMSLTQQRHYSIDIFIVLFGIFLFSIYTAITIFQELISVMRRKK